MDGMDTMGTEGGALFQNLCTCLMWLLVCLTCPLSVPILLMWWCCQGMCPLGADGCMGMENCQGMDCLGPECCGPDCCPGQDTGEAMGFAGYADTV